MIRETAVVETGATEITLKEAKYIALSLAMGILLGSGAAIVHWKSSAFSPVLIIPSIGGGVFGYMSFLAKYSAKAPNHYAVLLLTMVASFLITIILR